MCDVLAISDRLFQNFLKPCIVPIKISNYPLSMGMGVEAITNTYKNAAFPYRESEQGGLKLLILHLV